MKLINDFFEIIAKESNDNELRCQVKINPDHYIYQAHFPGNPVTPGVCLIQMAEEILRQEYDKDYQLFLLKSIKFKKIVEPADKPVFVFNNMTEDEEGHLCVNVGIGVDDDPTMYVKMSLQYEIRK